MARDAQHTTGPSGDATPDPDPTALTNAVTLRPGSAIATGVVGLVAGLGLILTTLIAPEPSMTFLASIVLAMVLVWVLVVRPCVKIHDEGLRVVNPLRTTDVSWPMITGVRTRWLLELSTHARTIKAWGVPADPGRPRYGRGALNMGLNRTARGEKPAQPSRPKVEAQTVAAEVERRIEADSRRKDGRTARILETSWDPAPVGLLLAAVSFFVIALLA